MCGTGLCGTGVPPVSKDEGERMKIISFAYVSKASEWVDGDGGVPVSV